MKKVFLIFVMLLLTGCNREYIDNSDTKIEIVKSEIEYREEIALYDLIKIEDGNILTENYKINTSHLGESEIIFSYKNSKNKEKKSKFNINVVDKVAPLILSSSKYTTYKDEKFDLSSSIVCLDNHDRNMKCEIEGKYDITTNGEYKVNAVSCDKSGNKGEKEIIIVVKDKPKENNTSSDSIYKVSDFINKYKTNDNMIAIDVSSWQGDIDFNKVKKEGVEAVIIRVGFGDEEKNTLDNKFYDNLKGAKEAGLKVGLYFYSYARKVKTAVSEAKWVIEKLNGEEIDLPVAFDWEEWGKVMSYKLNIYDLNDIATAFMDEITKSGYKAINYGSARYLEQVWNTPNYPNWLAYYTSNNDFEEEYEMWQITNTGKVNGISGYVDLDIILK